MDEIERVVEVKNIPEQIYLQIGEEIEMDDVEDFENIQNNYEITWCKDKINDNDIEYIHKDKLLSEKEIVEFICKEVCEEPKEKGKCSVEESENMKCMVIKTVREKLVGKIKKVT